LIFGTDSRMLIALKQRRRDLVRGVDPGSAETGKMLGGLPPCCAS
jgi:hypothetical protein